MNKFLYINHHIIYLYIMHFLLCILYKTVYIYSIYMCIIIMCNIELINKICLYYIYSKEIRRLVITSNNAPVVK